MKKVIIIGFGKLGSHLYYALNKTGRYKADAVKTLSEFSKTAQKKLQNAEIIILCVKDSQILSTAVKISKLDISLKDKVIMHTSGAMTSDELMILKNKGSYTASFHPVQSFAKKVDRFTGGFKDIYIAVEGAPNAVKTAAVLAKSIGSIPFMIRKENKVYHHICCVMSSNFLSALNYRIEETGGKKIRINGFKNVSFLNIYRPLAEQTLKNLSNHGAAGSLTGPIERNDILTVKRHLNALKKENNELLMFYILMGIETVKLAFKKKSLNNNEANELYKLFSNYIIKQ